METLRLRGKLKVGEGAGKKSFDQGAKCVSPGRESLMLPAGRPR